MFTLFLEEIESISKNPRQQTLAVGVEPTCILSSETVYIAFVCWHLLPYGSIVSPEILISCDQKFTFSVHT